MKRIVLGIITALELYKISKGHQNHITGTGVHKDKSKYSRKVKHKTKRIG